MGRTDTTDRHDAQYVETTTHQPKFLHTSRYGETLTSQKHHSHQRDAK